ncbi:MAG: M1 family metallopeptidase [Calditrichaeota bacterium]|nr:M1 family metallopeptidase [Calditrichota bacterium]
MGALRNGWLGGLLFVAILLAKEPMVIFPEPLSPRNANYDIVVRLAPETRMLFAREILTWKNISPQPATELQFHLYLNAFRNNRSTFMKESGGRHRGQEIDEEDGWGFVEVLRMERILQPADLPGRRLVHLSDDEWASRVVSRDLTAAMRYIQPDDGNPHDKTVLRVPLNEPVLPGDSIRLRIDFVARLPQPPFARTGAREEYFFVAQWFPKIGVLTPEGWNCHQFHLNSEFFADFGVYNVWMTVPEENIVGATGLEVEVIRNGDGTATHFYHAEDVHDFAWTTSPEFVEFRERVQDVDVRLLIQPDHRDQAQRHLDAARVAITYFQNWYGDYPFPNLTIVDPRRGAGGSGGMEYPTLITVGTRYGLPEGIKMVEGIIIHEFGHNYWYHLLASNEFEESWLDEGINSYTEVQIIRDYYGNRANLMDYFGIQMDVLQFHRAQYLSGPDYDPVVRKAWEFYSPTSYGINSYSKPALLLTTLQNYLGWETMLQIMRTYVERFRFKHPTTRDFIQVASEVAGEDLSWFFDQALYRNAVLDYSVAYVRSKKVKKPRGYDFTQELPEEARSPLTDSLPLQESISDTLEESQTLYETEVRVRRLGDFVFPVEVEMVFADGVRIREKWDGKELWKKYRYVRPARLLYATVDPDRKIPLDVNYTNNSRTVKPQYLGLIKVMVRYLFWMQFLLEQPDILNGYEYFFPF